MSRYHSAKFFALLTPSWYSCVASDAAAVRFEHPPHNHHPQPASKSVVLGCGIFLYIYVGGRKRGTSAIPSQDEALRIGFIVAVAREFGVFRGLRARFTRNPMLL